ncbi:MAG: SIS domain-containing protein [Candidatus Zixiibacteriota bacterium]
MTNEERMQFIIKAAEESAILRKTVGIDLAEKLTELSNLISGVFGSGGKIMICGNGGSAADASHMAGELVVRLTSKRNRQALPAIALSTDPSVLTAAGNDFGFDQIFARQIEALGNQGDLLLVISTSGNSTNLVNAVASARKKKMLVAALLGGNGGKLVRLSDKALVIPHQSVQRIQEEQIFLIHLLVELVESDLFG